MVVAGANIVALTLKTCARKREGVERSSSACCNRSDLAQVAANNF